MDKAKYAKSQHSFCIQVAEPCGMWFTASPPGEIQFWNSAAWFLSIIDIFLQLYILFKVLENSKFLLGLVCGAVYRYCETASCCFYEDYDVAVIALNYSWLIVDYSSITNLQSFPVSLDCRFFIFNLNTVFHSKRDEKIQKQGTNKSKSWCVHRFCKYKYCILLNKNGSVRG